MTALLAIFGGLSACLLGVAAVSPYVARWLALVLIAYANALQSGREMFRSELARLEGPVVGK